MMKSKEEIEGLGNLYLINETRKWVGDDIPDVYTQDDIIKAVAWGYDEGFCDATKWHYPSKGELPEKDGEYLCRYYKYDLCFSKLAHYRVEDNKWYHLIYDEEYRMPKPDAWQYIVPPKEEV